MNDYNQLKAMCEQGLTFQEIAAALGVTRQRAHQLIHNGQGKVLGLKHIREKAIKDRVVEEQRQFRQQETQERNSKYGVNLSRKEFYSDTLRAEQYHRLQLKKKNAHKAGVPFDLTWGDLVWPENCPVLGVPIDYFAEAGRRSEYSCSFDRLDNTRGYVPGNVMVMSWRANRIKNDGTAQEHRRIADWLDKLDATGVT